jgi:hypothetical protein
VARGHAEIVADLRAFAPQAGDWRRLDDLLAELWQTGSPRDAIEDLLGVFERYPDEDGAGVFWSILHGLESLPGSEVALVRSVQRKPSELGVLMVRRLLNSGWVEVDGVPLYPLLHEVASRPGISESIRQMVLRWLDERRE